MKSLLILQNIHVENANAISGITYGFPAITHFLGFTHALSRKLQNQFNLILDGCAVICHQSHIQAYRPTKWHDYVFSLTRNPLTKEGETAPFNQEGRMHLDISLIIPCDFDALAFTTDDVTQDKFERFIENQTLAQRLAGGSITSIGKVTFVALPEDSDALYKQMRKTLLKLLPGFALVDRSVLLTNHHANNPQLELLDTWLDFVTLKYQAKPELEEGEELNENTKAKWEYIPKPGSGWLVPIMTGYKAISPLYEKGKVARARDPDMPFCFVESVYGIGEWLSLHRVKKLEEIIWRYHAEDDWYLATNNF